MGYSPDVLSYGFGGIVLLGGVIGYMKVGSLMSLGSGVLFGTLLAYGAYRTSVNPKDFVFIFAVSAVLCGLMGVRFFKSGKFMPAGLVASLSLLQVLRFGMRFLGN